MTDPVLELLERQIALTDANRADEALLERCAFWGSPKTIRDRIAVRRYESARLQREIERLDPGGVSA